MSTLTAVVPYVRPPSADRLGAGAMLALLVHAGLIAGLAAGVSWKHAAVPVVSAELWAAVPRIAGAAPVEPPAPPPPPPKPVAPAPAPVAPPPPPPPAAVQREAQIAVEQRKAAERKAAEQEAARLRAEAERLARDKALRDKQLAAEKAAADKKLVDKKAAEKAAVDKADAERLQRLREANLARMRKELTSTPAPTPSSGAVQALPQPGRGPGATPGTGSATESAGPSAGYAGRVSARIKANTRGYSGPVADVPAAEVLLNVAPDGRIISRRLTKSSGVEAWDRAVLDAIDRTEVLPRDVDGRVPAQFLFLHKPDDR